MKPILYYLRRFPLGGGYGLTNSELDIVAQSLELLIFMMGGKLGEKLLNASV